MVKPTSDGGTLECRIRTSVMGLREQVSSKLKLHRARKPLARYGAMGGALARGLLHHGQGPMGIAANQRSISWTKDVYPQLLLSNTRFFKKTQQIQNRMKIP
jgi:hypothetical protein